MKWREDIWAEKGKRYKWGFLPVHGRLGLGLRSASSIEQIWRKRFCPPALWRWTRDCQWMKLWQGCCFQSVYVLACLPISSHLIPLHLISSHLICQFMHCFIKIGFPALFSFLSSSPSAACCPRLLFLMEWTDRSESCGRNLDLSRCLPPIYPLWVYPASGGMDW